MYPHKRSLVKKWHEKPVVLLGVNSDKDRNLLKKTIAKEQISWKSWWDEGRVDGPIHRTWQVSQRPTIHILDQEGIIRFWNVNSEDVEGMVEKLLAEKAGKKKD